MRPYGQVESNQGFQIATWNIFPLYF
jgi:hypothetical protein